MVLPGPETLNLAGSEWDVPASEGVAGPDAVSDWDVPASEGIPGPETGEQVDTGEQMEASRTVKVRTKTLSKKPCFEYRDFGRCQYGRKCRFQHLRQLPALRAAPWTPPKETPTRQEKPLPEIGSEEVSTSTEGNRISGVSLQGG